MHVDRTSYVFLLGVVCAITALTPWVTAAEAHERQLLQIGAID